MTALASTGHLDRLFGIRLAEFSDHDSQDNRHQQRGRRDPQKVRALTIASAAVGMTRPSAIVIGALSSKADVEQRQIEQVNAR